MRHHVQTINNILPRPRAAMNIDKRVQRRTVQLSLLILTPLVNHSYPYLHSPSACRCCSRPSRSASSSGSTHNRRRRRSPSSCSTSYAALLRLLDQQLRTRLFPRTRCASLRRADRRAIADEQRTMVRRRGTRPTRMTHIDLLILRGSLVILSLSGSTTSRAFLFGFSPFVCWEVSRCVVLQCAFPIPPCAKLSLQHPQADLTRAGVVSCSIHSSAIH